MAAHSLLTFFHAITPPAILLFALNTPSYSYRNYATRALAALAVTSSAGFVIATVKIENAPLAFMTGLLEGWIVIWAAVLLIHYNPAADFRRRRWSKVACLDGEYEEGGSVWQRYPRGDLTSRLAWTVDLLVSFRGVGWQVGDANDEKVQKTGNANPRIEDGQKASVLSALLKICRDLLVFQGVLWIAAGLEGYTQSNSWQRQVLDTVTWLATSVPFINFCHSTWTLIGELSRLIDPMASFDIEQYNPSPWGPIAATIEFGLAGLWGVTWHNYFKFGFQSASEMLVPRTANPQLKPLVRMARMVWSFVLSGAIHACGSYMLPGPTRPSSEFVFFLCQGVAVTMQITVYDEVLGRQYRRILNPILIAAWLCWTEPLIFGDQRLGGMWR